MAFRLKRIQQQVAAKFCEAQDPALISESAGLLTDLRNDLVVLKGFDGTPRKIAYKKERIDHYLPWVKGLIEGDQGQTDKILSYMLVWSMDISAIDHFLMIAHYMEKHGLQPPFETKLPSFVSDNARENINDLTLEEAEKIADFLAGKDVHQNSHAHFLRLLGEKLLKHHADAILLDDLKKVAGYWKTAVDLNASVGIKTKLDNLLMKINEADAQAKVEQTD